ncbi:hypothetical protein [Escherichia coli]|uniref:hypothetical protein n=1 Tax=Escherichia coli TaxID=562 RepID=UPI00135DF3D3|nr:hypothetical protein [Escherichia coli]MXF08754.1 hypothetical protein [Escherichia coli]
MRNFSKKEIYRLIHNDNCTGLIIAAHNAHVYQQLNDIVCGQPKVISGSIHPLAVGNYTAVNFFHSAELIGRITLNRSAE